MFRYYYYSKKPKRDVPKEGDAVNYEEKQFAIYDVIRHYEMSYGTCWQLKT